MEKNDLDQDRMRERLLDAAIPHVVFDGWTDTAFLAAAADAGIDPALARVIAPRGAIDLAVAYHKRGDRAMLDRLAKADLSSMRFRERVAAAVRFRLEEADREIVRRGMTLFALPNHAPLGASLVWGTADAIWTALGDKSDDINWYSKRAILSGVYSSTILYWLGDDSLGHAATWEFLDRRIDDVMRFESFKARVRENKPLMQLLSGPLKLAGRIRPPRSAADHMPGRTER
ncbi:COQ9 family protein [Ostreiculturibacter nitratireducens]|uniref:COQ9 family protein n=1 Tax=Ostreiculturibacter nitratireducens TaxID=3075226 RepID=UPI0031B59648